MAFLGFKTAKEKDEERKKKIAAAVTEQQRPPSSLEQLYVHQQRKKAGLRLGYEIHSVWEKSQQLKKKKVK